MTGERRPSRQVVAGGHSTRTGHSDTPLDQGPGDKMGPGLAAGVPVKDVAAMLGHSPTVCADIYGHATPAGDKEAAQRLVEALGQNKP